MRFMADENIPIATISHLRDNGIDVSAIIESNPGLSDLAVISAAESQQRVLLTFDLDFGELAFRKKLQIRTGIVLFRILPKTPIEPAETLLALLAEKVSLTGKITVVEKDHIRQRLLPQ